MRTVRILLVVPILLVLLGACSGRGPDGAPVAERPLAPDQTTTSGSVPPATEPPVATTAVPIEIPDDAIDLTGQARVTVVIEDNVFVQRSIVVTAGTEVEWVNKGRNPHNVTPAEDGAFEPLATAVFNDGGSGSRTFDTGTFAYYCSIHGSPNRGQRGTVYVVP